MSPEARQRLDAGFRRRVVERQAQYAATWQHAIRCGQSLGLGEPLGIYRTEISPRWRGRVTRWLYGYAEGMAELDPGEQPRVVRWAEVTGVVDEWTSAGSESASLWDYEGFRLTVADGRAVPITTGYANALDPYGPVGGLIRALTPRAVGDAIPRFPSIADLINDQAVARVVERQAAAVRAGETIVRGDLRVTRDGIGRLKDPAVTPWAAIERVELRPGRVKVRPIAGRPRKYDNYRDGSGYAVLCRLLLALGVEASFEARG
jgi:hypothetical protein